MKTTTPIANQPHIAIFGKRNAGKSSLLNALLGQEVALVSPIKGTTTDPVSKSMEFIPVGPVVFIDTAGLDDEGDLGDLRVQKTLKVLERTNIALYVIDAKDIDLESYEKGRRNFERFKIPHILVINKIDTCPAEDLELLRETFTKAIFISTHTGLGLNDLKAELIKQLEKDNVDPPIVGDLVPAAGTVVLVVPVDSEAPKGRLILPQVQVIRDCLDHGLKSYVVRDTELESALSDLKDIDLVITDSQVFAKVNEIVPRDIKLTSFSMLFARYKGDLEELIRGVKVIKDLPEGARILIAESCTHNTNHEDIGKIKIPALLQRKTKKNFNFDFSAGHDFSNNLEQYSLIIHCGSCMLNRKTMLTRIGLAQEKNIPITNYGVTLAYVSGILDRTIEVFNIDL